MPTPDFLPSESTGRTRYTSFSSPVGSLTARPLASRPVTLVNLWLCTSGTNAAMVGRVASVVVVPRFARRASTADAMRGTSLVGSAGRPRWREQYNTSAGHLQGLGVLQK